MNESYVVARVDGGVMKITIDRQEKLNALNQSVMAQLHSAFQNAASDSEVRSVILTGAGDRAFVAGADISEIRSLDNEGVAQFIQRGNGLMNLIENLGKPVIAAVNGFALGGGCELALACSLRIASESARLGLPEIQLGLMPGYGGSQRMSRLIGRGRALEIMMTGKPVDAQRALQWGLVNSVVPADELQEAAENLAAGLAQSAPLALRGILKAVHGGADLEFPDGLELEAEQFFNLFSTEDMREGTAAFLEKRKAEFKGR